MNVVELAARIDHTALKPDATAADISRVCQEAIAWGCASVCVNSSRLAQVVQHLKGSGVRPCPAVGFPLGACSTATKVAETNHCVDGGAEEVDMVMNVGWFRDEAYDRVAGDVAAVKGALGEDVILKVILETALLSIDEVAEAARLVVRAGADFVKTSTGFHAAGGASVDAVRAMRHAVGAEIGVKASGGIRDLPTALQMLDAGATRLGVSATVQILGDLAARQ
jgi:deoxyribose-phosphate aldolase